MFVSSELVRGRGDVCPVKSGHSVDSGHAIGLITKKRLDLLDWLLSVARPYDIG